MNRVIRLELNDEFEDNYKMYEKNNVIEDSSLADEYVREFVLDHFEDGGGGGGAGGGVAAPETADSVKREDPSPNNFKMTWNTAETAEMPIRVRNMTQQAVWQMEDKKFQALSPPPDMIYPHAPMSGQPILVNAPVTGGPSTPPETPPGLGSPTIPYNTQTYSHFSHRQPPGLVEEMMWLPNSIRTNEPQPLDLRPHNCNGMSDSEWERREYLQIANQQNGGSFQIHHLDHLSSLNVHSSSYHHSNLHSNRPLSVCSTGSSNISPRQSGPGSMMSYNGGHDDLINDDMLMSLSVRELNKRLHGCPRDEVVRLKQKRRTLKNRGYAQNCRSKRLQQRHDLESMNRTLHNDIHRLKVELSKVIQERDQLQQKLQRQAAITAGQPHNLNSDGQSSPEFYL